MSRFTCLALLLSAKTGPLKPGSPSRTAEVQAAGMIAPLAVGSGSVRMLRKSNVQ